MNKMIINRYNYHEFFLLYVDNELNGMEREAVENFILQNADLEEELVMLQQSVLKPDAAIVFENKESLLYPGSLEDGIHPGNVDEFFILYADNELSDDKKEQVENFVLSHPQYREEFDLLQSIKLVVDESVIFPDKKALYRHEKAGRLVIVPWWRMSAAAVVLLLIGLLYYNTRTGPTASDPGTLVKKTPSTRKAEATPGAEARHLQKPSDDSSASQQRSVALAGKHKSSTAQHDLAENKPKRKEKVSIVSSTGAQNIKPAIIEKKQEPMAAQISNDIKQEPERREVVVATIDPAKGITQGLTNSVINTNGLEEPETNNITVANTEVNENILLASATNDKKNSLRGILRKASRLIDKTTSFRSSKNSSLLIGNVEIAFQ